MVAVSSYDEFPPEVKSLPRVGALLDPDMERILALRPDLVVIYGSQTDLQAQLARAGIRVFNYRHAGLAGVFNTLKELGAAVGRPAKASGSRARSAAGSTRIQARVRGRPSRARCSSSSAIRRRCAACTSAAASAFSTTCSRLPAA